MRVSSPAQALGLHLLMTRPEPDGSEIARELESIGFKVTLYPLLIVRMHDLNAFENARLESDLGTSQGLVFTSRNGVRAAAQQTAFANFKDLPVFAVGDSTALAAREMGHANVYTAGGDIKSLETLIRRTIPPCCLLHVAGTHRAGSLATALPEFQILRQVLYTAEPRKAFDEVGLGYFVNAGLANKGSGINCIPLYSPRTARVLVDLMQAHDIAHCASKIHIVALSNAVAWEAQRLRWRDIKVAAAPRREDMEALLKKL